MIYNRNGAAAVCAVFALSANRAFAAEPLPSYEFYMSRDEAVVAYEALEEIIRRDNLQYFRTFERKLLSDILVFPDQDFGDKSYNEWALFRFYESVDANYFSLSSNPIGVLNLEQCFTDGTTYGLQPIAEVPQIYRVMIDEIRIKLALEAEGLSIGFPSILDLLDPNNFGSTLAASLRESMGESGVPGEQARVFNTSLFDLYRTGRYPIPLVVVDHSEGCGYGDFGVQLVSTRDISDVLFLSDLEYEICRSMGKDVWDRAECRFIRDGSDYLYSAGIVHLKITFSDGQISIKKFDLEQSAQLREGEVYRWELSVD